MLLFGFFLLVLGLVCTGLMAATTKRQGPTGGLPGPGAEERARQYRMVAIGTAVAGAVVLVVNLLYLAVT